MAAFNVIGNEVSDNIKSAPCKDRTAAEWKMPQQCPDADGESRRGGFFFSLRLSLAEA
ncbi:hypothetical protein HNP82_002209 [Catenibacillus scindens]|uniref:Uncharacterized protein n=1 Tax=Catenibacillus scindens TaxID=673271 RepID=A0A7W8HC85_9FIRM|nr:hypothetical protein [Catenibacillus scindens]MBB5265070.1 hypothetical protein [Catenibacillus scindens]